jgi:hypothetical protein
MDTKLSTKIGTKTFYFDTRDDIFKMTDPIVKQLDVNTISGFKDENCILCKKDIPNQKNHRCCEFCGNLACDKCLYKTRKFKASPIFTYDGVGDISF